MEKMIKDMTESELEITVDQAWSIIRQDYWNDVRDVAGCIIDAMKSKEIEDSDEYDTYIHETIDGTQRVIYTWQAKTGLMCTDNADAFREYGDEMALDDGDIAWSRLMYFAMLRDVENHLQSEGYGSDWFDRDDTEESEESEADA